MPGGRSYRTGYAQTVTDPLLLFERVRLEAPEGGPSELALAVAQRMLCEGGQLAVIERLERRIGGWQQLVDRLAAAEERLAALAPSFGLPLRTDAEVGPEPLDRPEPGDLLVEATAPGLNRWARIDEAIRGGWPVLLPGTVQPERIVVLLPQGADPASAALQRLRVLVPTSCPITALIAARGRQSREPTARGLGELLDIDDVTYESFASLPGTDAPSLAEALEAGPPPLVIVPFELDAGLLPMLTALGVLRVAAASTLVLPPTADSTPAPERWDVCDLVLVEGLLLGALEVPSSLGAPTPVHRSLVTARAGDQRLEPVRVRHGQVAIPAVEGSYFALAPTAGADSRVRALARALRPDERPIELVPLGGNLPPLPSPAKGLRRFGLRLDPRLGLDRLQREASEAGLEGIVDGGAILRDGSPSDLPSEATDVRARRVAARLVLAGYPLAGTWIGGELEPAPTGDRLQVLTGAGPTTSSVAVEWDNGRARRRLLRRFEEAEHSICVQTYQVQDDPAVRELELALARAGSRGVPVRVLADAVWSARGTPDTVSPVLARLSRARGVEVRLTRPFAGLPSITDLKARDHRKCALIDGWAVVGGRNLGEPYLRGFDEVPLWDQTPYRDVPWLDAGAELQGAAVDQLRTSFERAWADGVAVGSAELGDPPQVPARAALEQVPVRVVQHESLRDAHTLDLYRELIDGADSRLTVVNTFPLQLELLEALRRALARGVELRVLVGNVRPLHGERIPFPGGGLRDLANGVIHGRLDILVLEGAAVHEFAVPLLPGWDPALVQVLPHVHAKCLSADGQRFTVGSANLDITAAYWESEVVLLVEDAGATAAFDGELDVLFAQSPRIDPEDPHWRERAERRAWISRNWPSSLG